MRRSEAEVIAEREDGAPGAGSRGAVPLVDRRALDEIDAEMREIGPEVPPLPTDVVPRGIPASHWWWTLPAAPPGRRRCLLTTPTVGGWKLHAGVAQW